VKTTPQTAAPRAISTTRPRQARSVFNENSLRARFRRFLEDPDALRDIRHKLPSWADEFGAIALIIVGIFALSALLNPVGEAAVSSSLAAGLRQAFGIGAYVVSLSVLGLGIALLLSKAKLNITLNFDWMRILAIEIAFVSLQGLFHLLAFDREGRALARAGEGGGYVGWAISSLIGGILGTYLAIFALLFTLAYSIMLAFHVQRSHVRRLLRRVGTLAQELSVRLRPTMAESRRTAPDSVATMATGETLDAAAMAVVVASRAGIHVAAGPEPETAQDRAGVETGSLRQSPVLEISVEESRPVETSSAPGESIPVMPAPPVRLDQPDRLEAFALPAPPPLPPRLPKSAAEFAVQESRSPEEISPANPLLPNAETELSPMAWSDDVEPADPGVYASEVLPETESPPDLSGDSRRTTLTINGQVVTLPLPGDGDETPKPAQPRLIGNGRSASVSGKRYFTVDSYQDRVKVGKREEMLPPLELLRYTDLKLPSE
jgi:hypothetical protein